MTLYEEKQKEEIIEKARGVRHFLIRLDKTHKDELELSNGQKLYLDPKFNEARHRHHFGHVLCPPRKLEGEIQRGAKVWFHHLVTTIRTPQKVVDGIFYVGWTDHVDACNSNQIFAYQNEGEEVKAFQWWVFVEPIGTTKNIESSVIDLSVVNQKNVDNMGRVAIINEKTSKYYGVNIGDVVVYKENQRYEVDINGKTYYRVRPENLIYHVKENNEHTKGV